MIESYLLLSEVLRVLKQGLELPPWFQDFARRFAADSRLFVSLQNPTVGGALSADSTCLYVLPDMEIGHYVAATVSFWHSRMRVMRCALMLPCFCVKSTHAVRKRR
jgi:hypothetical protein